LNPYATGDKLARSRRVKKNALPFSGSAFFGHPATAYQPPAAAAVIMHCLPGPLAAGQAAVVGLKGPRRTRSLLAKRPSFAREAPRGTVQIADSRNFLANRSIAA
jgi:hypothetical protein